jgi:cytochrome c biogenesis DsbD-like protein
VNTFAAACLVGAGLLSAVSAAPQDASPAPVRRVTTDHLQIATYATQAAVLPGSAFDIVFDIKPRERMHVYAPGAEGYRIITVMLKPQPWLIVGSLQYPASEIYLFEPLNERVPVFQKPFRLTQPVRLSVAPEHRKTLAALDAITITGTLDYQACDDRICFAPKSIAVSHVIRLRSPGSKAAGG